MFNNSKHATMEDVAELAGVSIGTIDRVLHNRKGVSKKTKTKVLQIIKEIGYETNINASLLSQKKVFKIIVIIPYFQKGDYWEMIYDGVIQSQESNIKIIKVDVIYYNQFDVESFYKACLHTLGLDIDGVLIAPIYKKEASSFVNKLNEKKIPVVFVDTKVNDCEYLAYFGAPLFESGYLAAHLLFNEKDISEIVNFNVYRDGAAPNESMIKRTEGLKGYIKDHNLKCKIYDFSIRPNDFMHNINLFDSFFNDHPEVNHIITLNSRAYIISEWMEMRKIKNKKLIGFDMLQKNMEGLRKGYISIILAERTTIYIKKSMQALVDFLVFNKNPTQKDNLFPIDILNKYNVEFYNEI